MNYRHRERLTPAQELAKAREERFFFEQQFRHWKGRAVAAEERLRLYDARERQGQR